MQVIEIVGESGGLTLRQRWSTVFTILISIVLFLLGLNLRAQITTATSSFDSAEAGIFAIYPQGWLLDTASDNYIFRVRDMSQTGFKTTFQVSTLPVGPDAVERNIADRLTLSRIQELINYQVLSEEEIEFSEIISGHSISYTYVSSDVSPFLAGVPNVVQGLDILVLSSGQAIIITYRADASVFQRDFYRFEQFLRGLQF